MISSSYKDHYKLCREVNPVDQYKSRYSSVYDLTVDDTLITIDENLLEIIRQKIDDKIKRMDGCFIDSTGHAIRVDEWRDIKELYTLTESFMPTIEREIFGCSAKVEFLHPYRNIPSDKEGSDETNPNSVESSWKWHYDDCPAEFVKLFIYLNDVTKDSGCLKYVQDSDGNIPVIESHRTTPYADAVRSQKYQASRIPPEVVKKKLEDGGKIINVTGIKGSSVICTPNIIHRASCPKPDTVPRDVLFFFIRPTLKRYSMYLTPTYSYKPERNVKRYELD